MSNKMSPKMLLHRANTARSALGFIKAYREYMLMGELRNRLGPIVSRVDAGEVMPTIALPEIAEAIFTHIVLAEKLKQDEKLAQPVKEDKGTNKPWQVRIVNAKGELQFRVNAKGETEDLEKGFDLAQEADNWSVRRLVECASDCRAETTHSSMQVQTVMSRQTALATLLRQKRGPTMAPHKKSTDSLGFRMVVRQDHCRFSHG
jgi:hypothetical protein